MVLYVYKDTANARKSQDDLELWDEQNEGLNQSAAVPTGNEYDPLDIIPQPTYPSPNYETQIDTVVVNLDPYLSPHGEDMMDFDPISVGSLSDGSELDFGEMASVSIEDLVDTDYTSIIHGDACADVDLENYLLEQDNAVISLNTDQNDNVNAKDRLQILQSAFESDDESVESVISGGNHRECTSDNSEDEDTTATATCSDKSKFHGGKYSLRSHVQSKVPTDVLSGSVPITSATKSQPRVIILKQSADTVGKFVKSDVLKPSQVYLHRLQMSSPPLGKSLCPVDAGKKDRPVDSVGRALKISSVKPSRMYPDAVQKSAPSSSCVPLKDYENDCPVEKSSKAAAQAKINRQKKKNYIQGLEQKTKELSKENEKLTAQTSKLRKDKDSLEKEVIYLRNIIANQGPLADILGNLSGVKTLSLSTSFRNDRKRSSTEVDHDYDRPSKSSRSSPAEKPRMSGGVCLHVEGENVSLEFCNKCAQMATEREP